MHICHPNTLNYIFEKRAPFGKSQFKTQPLDKISATSLCDATGLSLLGITCDKFSQSETSIELGEKFSWPPSLMLTF